MTTNKRPLNLTAGFNRFMYGLFVVLSIYFWATNQFTSAFTNLGLALIFDPFKQEVSWQNRPRYQKVWLIVHLIVLFGLVGYTILKRLF
ncbi:MAG: hypothetical protein J0L66_17345 [Cytophagales bacterium]|nr:hypothetical protein [Cytophagales bacterium]